MSISELAFIFIIIAVTIAAIVSLARLIKVFFELMMKAALGIAFVAIGFVFLHVLTNNYLDTLTISDNLLPPSDGISYVSNNLNQKPKRIMKNNLFKIPFSNKILKKYRPTHLVSLPNRYRENTPNTTDITIDIATEIKEEEENEEKPPQTKPAYNDYFEAPINYAPYVIAESFFKNEAYAQRRVDYLLANGFQRVDYIWTPYYNTDVNKPLFAVLVEGEHTKKQEVLNTQAYLRHYVKQENIKIKTLRIIHLKPWR